MVLFNSRLKVKSSLTQRLISIKTMSQKYCYVMQFLYWPIIHFVLFIYFWLLLDFKKMWAFTIDTETILVFFQTPTTVRTVKQNSIRWKYRWRVKKEMFLCNYIVVFMYLDISWVHFQINVNIWKPIENGSLSAQTFTTRDYFYF